VTHESNDWEVMTGPEPRRSGRTRAVIAATAVAVLALGGTVAYAATSGGSATPAATGSASPSPYGHGGHWFDFGGMGVHGESTVKDQDTGKWIVRVWQRGTVEKVDGEKVTVKSEDGAEWTWTVDKSTTVLHDGTKSSGAGALKKNETAILTGTRSPDNTNTATRILSGTFDSRGPHNGTGPYNGRGHDDKGPEGNWHGNFPGHGPKDWRMPSPSTSPSDNGTTT